jgi:hypothetical protein
VLCGQLCFDGIQDLQRQVNTLYLHFVRSSCFFVPTLRRLHFECSEIACWEKCNANRCSFCSCVKSASTAHNVQ